MGVTPGSGPGDRLQAAPTGKPCVLGLAAGWRFGRRFVHPCSRAP